MVVIASITGYPFILNRVGDVFPAALRRSLGIAIRIWHSGAKRFPYPVRLRRGRLIQLLQVPKLRKWLMGLKT